jgi:hypothetical protein
VAALADQFARLIGALQGRDSGDAFQGIDGRCIRERVSGVNAAALPGTGRFVVKSLCPKPETLVSEFPDATLSSPKSRPGFSRPAGGQQSCVG